MGRCDQYSNERWYKQGEITRWRNRNNCRTMHGGQHGTGAKKDEWEKHGDAAIWDGAYGAWKCWRKPSKYPSNRKAYDKFKCCVKGGKFQQSNDWKLLNCSPAYCDQDNSAGCKTAVYNHCKGNLTEKDPCANQALTDIAASNAPDVGQSAVCKRMNSDKTKPIALDERYWCSTWCTNNPEECDTTLVNSYCAEGDNIVNQTCQQICKRNGNEGKCVELMRKHCADKRPDGPTKGEGEKCAWRTHSGKYGSGWATNADGTNHTSSYDTPQEAQVECRKRPNGCKTVTCGADNTGCTLRRSAEMKASSSGEQSYAWECDGGSSGSNRSEFCHCFYPEAVYSAYFEDVKQNFPAIPPNLLENGKPECMYPLCTRSQAYQRVVDCGDNNIQVCMNNFEMDNSGQLTGSLDNQATNNCQQVIDSGGDVAAEGELPTPGDGGPGAKGEDSDGPGTKGEDSDGPGAKGEDSDGGEEDGGVGSQILGVMFDPDTDEPSTVLYVCIGLGVLLVMFVLYRMTRPSPPPMMGPPMMMY